MSPRQWIAGWFDAGWAAKDWNRLLQLNSLDLPLDTLTSLT